ncbi:DUF1990 family protein [Saccharopolyspora shandongensis]
MRARLLRGVDYVSALGNLRHRQVNFTAEQVQPPEWHFDTYRQYLARERPGPPEPGGAWEIACRLVRDYEFSVPAIVRAVYDGRDPLLGRDMLLEGRFHGLRFYMGVRVTDVVDETRGGSQQVWGWAYATLEGHLERGRISYELVKDLESGAVEFVITGFSQRSPALGPITRLGWLLFGRRTQLRFYRQCGARLSRLVQDRLTGATAAATVLHEGDLVLAPSGIHPTAGDLLTVRWHHPGI